MVSSSIEQVLILSLCGFVVELLRRRCDVRSLMSHVWVLLVSVYYRQRKARKMSMVQIMRCFSYRDRYSACYSMNGLPVFSLCKTNHPPPQPLAQCHLSRPSFGNVVGMECYSSC